MGEHDGRDPDRAAIMARRRQFIAVALGGLASGCAPPKPNPTPTTTGETATATGGTATESESGSGDSESEAGESEAGDSESETGPQPCLKFDLPPEPGTDTGDTGDETDSGTETGPRPCLVPPGALP